MYKAQLLNQAAFFWSTHQTHVTSAWGTSSLSCKTLNCAVSYFAHEILSGNSKCSYRHPVPNSSNWLSQCCSVWLVKTSKICCKDVFMSYLKRVFSSRSAGGSSVIRVTSSCIQWSLERKSRSLRFCALHSCKTSSSSINSLRVTPSRSSSWSIWEVLFRSNFQNMMAAVAAAAGSPGLKRRLESEEKYLLQRRWS